MLYEGFLLEEHRQRLESEIAESKERSRDLTLRLDGFQKEVRDCEARLKQKLGLTEGDATAVAAKMEAAQRSMDGIMRALKQEEFQLSGSEWTLSELRAEVDQMYTDLKTTFGPLTQNKVDNATAKAKQPETVPGSAPNSAREAAKAERLSQSKTVTSLREAVTRIFEHLHEIPKTKLLIYDPTVEDVPHFTTWEQRFQTAAFNAKEKVERTERYLCNTLNAVASTFPDMADDRDGWASFVALVDDALRRTVLRTSRAAIAQYKRIFDGLASRELFTVNLKLGSNCRPAFFPQATELSGLITSNISKLATIGSDRYLGELTHIPAHPPAKPVDDAHGHIFYKSQVDFVNADEDISSGLTAIRTASAKYGEEIVAFVVEVEEKFERLWAPDMTAMPAPKLKEDLHALQNWLPKHTLRNAVLVNAFPLQDSVVSMCESQLQRLQQKATDAALNEEAIHKMFNQPFTLKGCTTNHLVPLLQEQKEVSSVVGPKPKAPTTGSATASQPTATKAVAEVQQQPKQAVQTRREASGASTKPTGGGGGDRTTPRSGSGTPRQSVNGTAAAQGTGATTATTKNSPSVSSTASSSHHSPTTGAGGGGVGPGGALESPRPSTTPVGTRVRSAGAAYAYAASKPSPQAHTPQKYQGPSSLRTEANVYSKAIGARDSGGTGTSTSSSPGAGHAGSSHSVEVSRASVGRSPDQSSNANRVPEVTGLSQNTSSSASAQKRSAWGTPTKSPREEHTVGISPTNSPSRGHVYSLRGPSTERERDDGIHRQAAAIHNSIERDQESLARIRAMKEREEQRLRQQQTAEKTLDDSNASRRRFGEEKSRLDAQEREKAAAGAREKQRRDNEQKEEMRKAREEVSREEKQRKDAEAAQRRAIEDAMKLEEAERKQRDLEQRLEAEMQRRAEEHRRVQDARRQELEEQRSRDAESQRLALEHERLRRLEREREEEERRLREEAERHQLRIRKLNEETSALRKKLQLPPVQPLSQRTPAEPDSPSPLKVRPQPHNHATISPLGVAGKPRQQPPTPETSPSKRSSYTLPQRPGSSRPLAPAPLPFEDDGVERSLLEEYKRCCAAASIKPNSGLLKKLPKDVGVCIEEINLDLNYIGIKGVQPLIHILKRNRGLRLLNLKDNNLENNEVRQLVAVLLTESGECLESLDLSNNPISLAGGSALLDLVTAKKTLTNIAIRGTLIQPKVVEKIVEAGRVNAKAKG